MTLAQSEWELIREQINAGNTTSQQNGTRFGQQAVNPTVVTDRLATRTGAHTKGRTAEEAACLIG